MGLGRTGLGRLLALGLTAAFAACLAATAAQAATCSYSYTQTGSGFCDGCKYQATITVSRNEACERSSVSPGGSNGPMVEYLSTRIIARAKHGLAGANGNMVAYKPNKDYVGPDAFVKEMVYRQNGKEGRYQVRYLVTVQ